MSSCGVATVTASGDGTLGFSSDFTMQKGDVFKILPDTRTTPIPLASPDWQPLIETITSGLARSIKDGYEDEDFQYYVYEAAMTAVYGDNYFTWRNKQRWG